MFKKYLEFNGSTLEAKSVEIFNGYDSTSSQSTLLVPDPNSVERIFGVNEAAMERARSREKKVMENGYKIIKELSYIKIQNIIAMNEDFRIFREYNLEMENAMQESIKLNGLLSPIIIWKTFGENYVVISGLERLKAYHAIYDAAEEVNDVDTMKKYEFIPSFVMGLDEITEMNAKHIYLDANLCSRTLDGEARVKAYSQYYMILKYFKEKRNEYNIIEEMQNKFRVSKQTIYNYLNLSKLIEPFMFLFQEKVLNFKSALKLSKFKREIQEKILKEIGIENITNSKISVLREDAKNEREFLINLKTMKEYKFPYWSMLKLKIPTKYLEEFIPLVQKLLRQNAKFVATCIIPKIIL